jgi:hypothetical protein
VTRKERGFRVGVKSPAEKRKMSNVRDWRGPEDMRPAPLVKGAAVRVLIPAGLCEHLDGTRFVSYCEPGTVGEYVGPHAHPGLKGWHWIKVGALFAPLEPGQFEGV